MNASEKTVVVGGVIFCISDVETAVSKICHAARSREGRAFHLSNAYCVALAQENLDYRRALNNVETTTYPDGVPVKWAMHRLSRDGATADDPRPGLVRGPTLFRSVLNSQQTSGLTHYLLGSTQETLTKLLEKIADEYPMAKIAGAWSPPFAPIDESVIEESVARVQQADPDIVWVGMGTPKQDILSNEICRRIDRPVVAVGAAFDFVAGTVREAPSWLRESGMEWVYRLMKEPSRLWKRYAWGNWVFTRTVLSETLAQRIAAESSSS